MRFLLATDPDALTRVLGVVCRTISRQLIDQAGLTRATGETGAVTLVQRFGSALNLNVHFHMLFLDGLYLTSGTDPPVFRQVPAPGANELQKLVEQIAARVGQALERAGLIERNIESAWLAAGAAPGPLDDLIGHSITYRIAVVQGPGRSCPRCRPLRRGCRGWKSIRTARCAQAGSPCMRARTSHRTSEKSSSGYAAT